MTGRTGAVLGVLAALGACSESSPSLRLQVESPAQGTDAYPFDAADELRLSIAEAGDTEDLSLVSAELGGPLALSEVPFGDDLVVHLSALVSGVEIAYGRSCVLDLSDESRLDVVARVYLSRAVRWGASADPLEPTRFGALAFAQADGSAVFIGGGAPVAERFDPLESGAFEPLSVQPEARIGGAVARFNDGSAAIVGGRTPAGDIESRVEILDAARATLQSFDGPGVVDHAAVTLVDDRVLVAGGRAGPAGVIGDATVVTRDAAVSLEPAALLVPRADHTLTRLSDEVGADVLVVGGRGAGGGPVAQAELFRPLRETFVTLPGAELNVPRWNHRAILLPGGFVLIVGGVSDDPDGPAGPLPPAVGDPVAVSALELFDPVEGRFVAAGELPPGAGLTEETATLLPDGRVLLAGGRDAAGEPVTTAFIARLDPIDGRVDVSPTDDLDVARAGHSAVVLCDGTVLVMGGTSQSDAPGAERYNPPSAGRR